MTAEGARLVCVPGLGLNEASWRPTLQALRAAGSRREQAVLELPGYGVRPARGADLRPEALAAVLVDALRRRPARPTVLAAHSASCGIVAHAVLQAPELVSALVLVGPMTDPRAGTWPRMAGRWLRTAGWERPSQVPVLARTYATTGPAWIARTMDHARREDLRTVVGQVHAPVLVVRGRHDRICPQDWADELVAAAPGRARSVTLDAGAHMVPLTHGARLAAALTEAW
ncbi:alpha/beta fold hydrolase [Nocardioides pantholopis]|uniref:alpha/beta fold hydrolase n=1 Tax=Nocardioides pantholopis TaxID=2483798 RepID=UPI000FD9C829|nr:alpha/beta hydrolase [Nocardioides pantholopis]